MFYERRFVDVRDGLTEWKGMDGKSKGMDEDGIFGEEEGVGREGE